ncbi:MAG: toprim domain-containing protein [Thermoanaerobaculia bacterium]
MIDRIKREVSVADLARRRGIELRGHGENLLGLCPFPDEHEPSLVITPAKNLWNCLGACNAGGDVIRWVERSENVTFLRAIELLHRGYPAYDQPRRVRPQKAESVECPINIEMNDRELLNAVVTYYSKRLNQTDAPDAIQYLERRGLWREEAIAQFRIGVADRSLGPLLPHPDLKAGKELRARLAKLGLYRADSGREHFNGCVVFPIVDRDGEVRELYGRKIRDDIRHRVGSHLYLPGQHHGIWNGGALTQSKEIVLCESIIDALTFWVSGIRNVIAAFGVNGFTDEMFEAMKACGTTRVLIAYDNDEAGNTAAAQLGVRLEREKITCARVLFPYGMDANEYARKVTHAPQLLAQLVRSAERLNKAKDADRGPIVLAHTEVADAVKPDDPRVVARREPQLPPAESVDAELLSLAAVVAVQPPIQEKTVSAPQQVMSRPRVEASDPASVDVTLGDRKYRVRGLEKNLSYAQLKVVLRVARGELFFLDQIDLVSARQRAQFIRQAAIDIGVKEEILKHDLSSLYRELEVLQEEQIKKILEPKERRPAMTDIELNEAIDLLRDPHLLQRVLSDYERCGIVGERTNKLVAFIAAVSRLLDDPLAIIIQSSSAAGKTKVMDAVLDFMPEEQRIRYSAMTGQSLFYFEGQDLKHKILAISEEEGAERATYALKLLQSEGQLTIASTGKDPQSGRLVTNEYHVEGPVMIFLTTTSAEIDEELLNRCIVLSVDEDREQTRAIHRLQREAETLAGLLAREDRQSIIRLHRNAQRLLKPMRVVNPYAPSLTFLDGRTRTRRDHAKYLTLIRTIALLHQHQRPQKTYEHRGRTIEYIEATAGDIALANELAHEVLGRSLDELAPQTRRLLEMIDQRVARECEARSMKRADYRFTNRDVREWTQWSDFQVRTHMHKLIAMEYVLVHRGGRGQSLVYELLYDGGGRNGRPFVMGLLDIATLNLKNNNEYPNADNEDTTSLEQAVNEDGLCEPDHDRNVKNNQGLGRPRRYVVRKPHPGNGRDLTSFSAGVVRGND